MKRKISGIILTLALCMGLAVPAFAAETIERISVKIPDCNAVFTFENVSAEYVIGESYDGLPEYRFAFPGDGGKAACSMPANVQLGMTWQDAGDPAKSNAGGGGPEEPLPAGWSESYPESWIEMNGKGLSTVSITVYNDGTLVRGDNSVAAAHIDFYFGHPVPSIGGQYPDDLISWAWQSASSSGAGGPNQMTPAGLAKYPVSALEEGKSAAVQPDGIEPEKPSSWAAAQVDAAITAKLVPEVLQSKYTQASTRAEFCALAVAFYETAAGKEITGRVTFSDTNDVNVAKAAAISVVTGIGGNIFDPGAKLTREQAAVILWRLAESVQNLAGSAGKPFAVQLPTFADNDRISGWAIDSVGVMQAEKIMDGVGNNTFAPKDSYTREQSIITVMRLYEALD